MLLRRDGRNLVDVLKVARVPALCKKMLLKVERMYDDKCVADTATKRMIEAVIGNLTDSEFLSLHRLLAHACSSNSVASLQLSRDVSDLQRDVLAPEDRPLYLCSCCGRTGATVVRGAFVHTISSSDHSHADYEPGGAATQQACKRKKKKRRQPKPVAYAVKRGQKEVAYSFATNAVYCNKKTKKAGCSKKRLVQHLRGAPPKGLPVPKCLMDRILLKTCSKRPMICTDKLGALFRIGARFLSACCRCGMMAELNSTTCIGHSVECAACRAGAELPEPPAGRRVQPKAKCAICSKPRQVSALAKALVFMDTDKNSPDYNRIVQASVCPVHVDGLPVPASLKKTRELATSIKQQDRGESPEMAMRRHAKAAARRECDFSKRITVMKRRARQARARAVQKCLEAEAEFGVLPPQPKRARYGSRDAVV